MTYHRWLISSVIALALPALPATAAPPQDFPTFAVPGREKEMALLRDLFWLHYPGAGPKATLWDEWLPDGALWPAVTTDGQADKMRTQWSRTLSERILDPEGYVATHQHASIAHQLGWPFPFWNQGRRGFGWHFSFKNTVGQGWRPNDLSKSDGWNVANGVVLGIEDEGCSLDLTNANAVITPPPWKCHTFEVPFIQIRWRPQNLGSMQPWIEWTTPAQTEFAPERRVYFAPPAAGDMAYTMVPMYRHPQWTGEVTQVRIGLDNGAPGKITLQALFSQYDTRHNINEQNFIRGCAKYFWWTRDLNFLRANLQRMRAALRYTMTEHHAWEDKVVRTTWVGHDGRSGLKLSDKGKEILTGRGIGNNYWDLLPFGNLDCYATIQYYDALRTMAAIEAEMAAHPEWLTPKSPMAFTSAELLAHAADVKTAGNRRFWNAETGRFVACEDIDGQTHDYGLTFLNLEAIYYDFASPKHARAILEWIDGVRKIAGDTSQGEDIYFWRFGPRATTRRNVEWYFWAWSGPESIPWGGQVQDGGAVLGFSYHDLMARLKVLGPDSAWQRLQVILAWFDEVQAAGGYRKYYDGSRPGSMQGGGTAGGLGLDKEFFESVLVPQVMLYGFLGFAPQADGFQLKPRLPSDWPELAIKNIRFQNPVLGIRVTPSSIEITTSQPVAEPLFVQAGPGPWNLSFVSSEGKASEIEKPQVRESDGALALIWPSAGTVRLGRNQP